MINDLLSNRVDLSLLVITKGLSKKISLSDMSSKANDEEMVNEEEKSKSKKNEDTYGNRNMAHVKLAERMRQRD